MQSARELLSGAKMDVIHHLNQELGTLRHSMQALLRRVGQRGFCPRCGDRIVYLRHAREPIVAAFDLDGSAHEATCTRRYVEDANHE